jgi:hypothetical protein
VSGGGEPGDNQWATAVDQGVTWQPDGIRHKGPCGTGGPGYDSMARATPGSSARVEATLAEALSVVAGAPRHRGGDEVVTAGLCGGRGSRVVVLTGVRTMRLSSNDDGWRASGGDEVVTAGLCGGHGSRAVVLTGVWTMRLSSNDDGWRAAGEC